jgi:hypothetical protein
MEVQIFVPKKANMAAVEKEYPDIYQDGDEKHGDLSYFVGKSMDEPNNRDFLTYQQAVECCGFVEGALPGAECVMEGNGGWAMGMIKRKNFSGLAVSPQQKAAYKRRSNSYWRAYTRGENTRAKTPVSTT